MLTIGEEIQTTAPLQAEYRQILTPEALQFLAKLHHSFNSLRLKYLESRRERQRQLNQGVLPAFLPETAHIREADWQVASTPGDLQKRWVEITGPVDRKMMINALNSGADVFMADFEDSLSPTWDNVLQGQINLRDAIRRAIEYKNPDGKVYALKEKTATLLVRPRGWHLDETRLLIDGQPVSASLFDFGLYFFHNAQELIPRGTIRATVLIETILAAFEMDEILYELRDHAAGLNAGRWDYIFSVIKEFSGRSDFVLPDRSQVVMTVPFMQAYTDLMIRTCHRRGAHAIGGMAAFIPSRRDEDVNELALRKVSEDKLRESSAGNDGTWVAHPDLVPHARKIFEEHLGGHPHQKDQLREDVNVKEKDLLDFSVLGGQITATGLRANISIAIQYLNSWLNGNGAAAINNLMEDVATAEISRAQIWQWIHHKATLEDGRTITSDLYRQIRDEEMEKLLYPDESRVREAVQIMDGLVLSDGFVEFLTIPAMKYI
jgi:malate synthase